MASGQLFADLGLPDLDPEHDRAMLCGSPQMIADTKAFWKAVDSAKGQGIAPVIMWWRRRSPSGPDARMRPSLKET